MRLDKFGLMFRDGKKLAMPMRLRFILGAGRVISRSLILARDMSSSASTKKKCWADKLSIIRKNTQHHMYI